MATTTPAEPLTVGTIELGWHDQKWMPLAVYDAEVARGVVHTPAWADQMATMRAEFHASVTPPPV